MFLVKYALQLKQQETEEYKVKEARSEKEVGFFVCENIQFYLVAILNNLQFIV